MEKKLKKEITELVRRQVDLTVEPTEEKIKEIIDDSIYDYSTSEYISINKKLELSKEIFNAIKRLDILQPLIDDKETTEIMINGHKNIFVEKKGVVTKLNCEFEKDKLEDVIQQIVSKVNRVVNEKSPICDARLGDGSRINIVLPPVSLNGPTMTIRKFPEKPITIDDLVKWKSLTKEVGALLEKMVQAKFNIFVCGGTGSGKTTFLNVLSNFIPKDERLITIEDSAELQIFNLENLVSLETRNKNIEGKGEITIRDLIKTSLRMRPDRIVVGEVRGSEAIDMLQAMNTGHDGSLSTGHANSPKDMLSRLETMILTGAISIPLEAIRKQIVSAIDVIVHLGRLRDKSRRVLEISEVIGFEKGEIQLRTLYKFIETASMDNKIIGELRKTESNIKNMYKFQQAGIDLRGEFFGRESNKLWNI